MEGQSQTSLYGIQIDQQGLTRARDVGLGHSSICKHLKKASTPRIAGEVDAADEYYIIRRGCIDFLDT